MAKAASSEQAVQCSGCLAGRFGSAQRSPTVPRQWGDPGVRGGSEGLEVLPAELGGTVAKVQLGGGKGTPISFAVANGC